MSAFLARHWFLLVLLTGVSVALLAPNLAGPLTSWAPPQLIILGALFLMAFTMPSRRLAGELRFPWAWLWACFISFGPVPALAWLLGMLPVHPDLGLGLLLVACLPCTLASAVLWTRLAGGNEATALATTLATNLTGWFFSVLWLTQATGIALPAAPLAMMGNLAVVVLPPVFLGQVCRAVPPLLRLADRYRPHLGYLSQGLVLLIIFKAAAQVGILLQEGRVSLTVDFLLLCAVLTGGVHVAGLVLGYCSSGWLGFDGPRRSAVALSGSQKTLPIGVWLFEQYFQATHPLALAPLLFYHASQLILDTVAVGWMKEKTTTEQPQEEQSHL